MVEVGSIKCRFFSFILGYFFNVIVISNSLLIREKFKINVKISEILGRRE